MLLAGGENSGPGVEEHRLRFLMGGVADGPSGRAVWRGRGYGGGVAVGRCWLRSCCVPCSRQFFKEVIQFLDKGFDVVEVVQIIPQECIQLCIAGQI